MRKLYALLVYTTTVGLGNLTYRLLYGWALLLLLVVLFVFRAAFRQPNKR